MMGDKTGQIFSGTRAFRALLIVGILSVPSIFFLFCSPVLWRDSDAFWQIAGKPGVGTILHWPPLYCFAARIPLAIGACWEALFFAGIWPGNDWWAKPVLTDTGLKLLLFCQHALLVGAWTFLVFRISSSWQWRTGIAIWFAIQSWAYVFAQSVGSESLSNVLILAFFAAGLEALTRLDWKWWIAAAMLLWLAILTRHINAVFAAALPGGVILLALIRWSKIRGVAPKAFLRMILAILVGIGAILAASATVHLAARIADIPFRSRMGYTYQWRLNYLLKFDPDQRREILNTLSAKSADPLVAAGILSLEGGIGADRTWNTSHLNDTMVRLVDEAYPELSARKREAIKDEQLNAIARQFLFAPEAKVWPSVLQDFLQSARTSFGQIAREPLMTTDFLREAREQKRFARIANLRALPSGPVEAELPGVMRIYLIIAGTVPLWLWASAVVMFSSAAFWRGSAGDTAAAWAISLILTAVLVTFLNVALTFQAPRFLLPVAAAIAAGFPMAAVAFASGRKSQAPGTVRAG